MNTFKCNLLLQYILKIKILISILVYDISNGIKVVNNIKNNFKYNKNLEFCIVKIILINECSPFCFSF